MGVGACAAKICVCCIECFEKCLGKLNKTAYMDVAITSSNYCKAASRAMETVAGEAGTIAILDGAQTIFVIAGMGIIGAGPPVATFFVCKNVPPYNDPEADSYVSHPLAAAFAAGVVCMAIAA